MNTTTETKISDLVLILLVYFLSLIVFGVFKVNIISDYLAEELVATAKISGYVSLSISALVSIAIISLLIGVLVFSNILFEFKIENWKLISSIRYTIYVFIVFELIKFILALYLLDYDLRSLNPEQDIVDVLKVGAWFYYDSLLKYLMIALGTLAFAVHLHQIQSYHNMGQLIIMSCILISGLYVSTIDFFSII